MYDNKKINELKCINDFDTMNITWQKYVEAAILDAMFE